MKTPSSTEAPRASNAINSTGEAVGASDFWIKRSHGPPEVWTIETRAALWWPGGTHAVILGPSTLAPAGRTNQGAARHWR